MKLHPLSLEDSEKIKGYQREHQKSNIIIILCISVAFILYSYTTKNSINEDWYIYLFYLSIIILPLIEVIKIFLGLTIDKNKLIGKVIIIDKNSVEDNPCILKFNNLKLKEIRVTQDIYEQFQIGDNVYIEVTHKTRQILNIHKVIT